MLEEQTLLGLFQLDVWPNLLNRFGFEDLDQELQQEILSYRKTATRQIPRMEEAVFRATKQAYLAGGFSPENPPAADDLDLEFPGVVLFVLRVIKDVEKLVELLNKLKATEHPPAIETQEKILKEQLQEIERSVSEYMELKRGNIPYRIRCRAEIILGLRRSNFNKHDRLKKKPLYLISKSSPSQIIISEPKPSTRKIGLPNNLRDEEKKIIHNNMQRHRVIEEMGFNLFDAALCRGQGYINWKGTKKQLSHFIFTCIQRGILQPRGVWDEVVKVFNVNGNFITRKSLESSRKNIKTVHERKTEDLLDGL